MDENTNTGIAPEGEEKFIEISVPTEQWKIDMSMTTFQEAGINCYSHRSPRGGGIATMVYCDPNVGGENQSIYVQESQIEEAKKVLANFPLEDVEVTVYAGNPKPSQLSASSALPLSTAKIIFCFSSIIGLLFIIVLFISYRCHIL